MDPDLDLSGPRAALVAAPMVRLPFGELPPTVGLGQQAFDEAEAAYDAGDDLTAARGFVRAGLLWCEHRNGMVASELPALSAAASPFASYLAGVHRRIHRFFADDFLASLDGFGADHAMNDPTLVTRLEIILNRDGTISRVGVAATSGMLPFDFGAVDSVHRGAPFPSAPEQILSGDGRVYMHWSFYRNTRACGTFNAEPYILPRPGERQRPAPGPTEDRPPPGRRQIPPGNLRDDMTGSLDQERRRTGVTSRSSMRAIDRSLVVRSRGGG